jgi:UrcA family protein
MSVHKRTVLQVLTVVLAMTSGACVDSGNAAYAAPSRKPTSVRVPVKDLDLTTHVGVIALYRRIRAAARSVCGDADIVFLEQRAESDRCVDEAIGNAVAKVGNAGLTDYYLTKTHRAQSFTTAQNSKVGKERGL